MRGFQSPCCPFFQLSIQIKDDSASGVDSEVSGSIVEQKTYLPANNDLFGADHFFLPNMQNKTHVFATFKVKKKGRVFLSTEKWPCLDDGT